VFIVAATAGCVLDIDSDLMLSSGSMLMSSAGGSDDIMDESWLQQQLDVDEHPVDSGTSPYMQPALNQCPLDVGNSSKTAIGNSSGQGDDVSRASGVTDSAATCDPATESRTSVTENSCADQSDSGLLLQANSVNYEPFQRNAEESMKVTNETNEEIHVSATTENGSEQDSQELVNDENAQSAVEEPVSISDSASESHLPTVDATVTNGLAEIGQTSDETQNASNVSVDEARMSADVDKCQLSQVELVEPRPQTATESSAERSEMSAKDAEDAEQTASGCVDAGEIVTNSDVNTDSKDMDDETADCKLRLQSSSNKISPKKETGSPPSKPTVAVTTKDKHVSGRSATNPRSTGVAASATSRRQSSRGAANTEQPANKTATEKLKLKRDNENDGDTKQESKSSSSSQKATTVSASSRGRRDARERPWNQTKKPKKDAGPNASTKEAAKTSVTTDSNNTSSTAASEKKSIDDEKNEAQIAENQEKEAADKLRETTSKPTNNNPTNDDAKSTNPKRLLGSVHNAGKETGSSTRKSAVARSNPGPVDGDKDAETQRRETRTATAKSRTRSTDLNPSVSGPAYGGTAAADRLASKLPKDSSTTGNPGNPKSAGDRATTSGESKESSPSTKKTQQQRSTGGRATTTAAADKPATTASSRRGAGQASRTALRSDKSSDTAAGDSKAPKSSGKKSYRVVSHGLAYTVGLSRYHK